MYAKLERKNVAAFNIKSFYDLKEKLENSKVEYQPLGTEKNPLMIDKLNYVILKKKKC